MCPPKTIREYVGKADVLQRSVFHEMLVLHFHELCCSFLVDNNGMGYGSEPLNAERGFAKRLQDFN